MPTPRWFLLALIIPAALALSEAIPALLPAAVIYAVALLIITWQDWRAAGGVGQFRAERTHDSKLSLGAANPVTLTITHRGTRPTTITLRDEPPLAFVVIGSADAALEASPSETVEHRYSLRPPQRGDYAFGDLNLRWTSPLGLVVRQGMISLAAGVKVYPNIYAIRQFELLVKRDQLAEIGLRGIRQIGEGTAFESLRDYTPDDPYKSINWKATARRGKPISTDYEPERSQRIILLIDAGRTMRGAVRATTDTGELVMAKLDYVINCALLLSYAASRLGDQTGVLTFADRVRGFITPAPGNAHFQKLLDSMYALTSEPVEPDYRRAISYLRAHHAKRSLVILFTDLSGARASESLLAHMPTLAPRHLPLLVTIRDPILDQEARQLPDSSEAVYRRAVAEKLIDERRLLLDNLRRRGVFTLDTDAQHLSVDAVNRYLALRARV